MELDDLEISSSNSQPSTPLSDPEEEILPFSPSPPLLVSSTTLTGDIKNSTHPNIDPAHQVTDFTSPVKNPYFSKLVRYICIIGIWLTCLAFFVDMAYHGPQYSIYNQRWRTVLWSYPMIGIPLNFCAYFIILRLGKLVFKTFVPSREITPERTRNFNESYKQQPLLILNWTFTLCYMVQMKKVYDDNLCAEHGGSLGHYCTRGICVDEGWFGRRLRAGGGGRVGV